MFGLFGSIIADALLVSGNPNCQQDQNFIAEVCGIAFLTTTGAVLAWFRKRAEWGVGMMALFCMAALLLAKGGPFIEAKDNTPGISVYIPLFVMVTLISAWIMFARRNTATQSPSFAPRKSERKIIIGLIFIAVVAAISSGKQFAEDVANLDDKSIPHFVNHDKENRDKEKAFALLKTLHGADYAHRGRFYRYASEIALSNSYYKQQYYANSTDNSGTPPNSSMNPSAKHLPPPDEAATQRHKDITDAQIYENSRLTPPTLIRNYLNDRLDWVHPAAKKHLINTPVSGNTAKDRLEYITQRRNIYIFKNYTALWQRLEELFSELYVEQVVNNILPVAPKHSKHTFSGAYTSEEEQDRQVRDDYGLPLFDNLHLPTQSYATQFVTQMALPVADEATVAYATYTVTPLKADTETVSKLKKEFLNLPAQNHQVILPVSAIWPHLRQQRP